MNLTQKTDLELKSLMAWRRTISEIQFQRFCLEWLMGNEAWGSLGIALAINSVSQSLGDVSSLSVPAAPTLNLTFKSTTDY